jgi:hypothetical protein
MVKQTVLVRETECPVPEITFIREKTSFVIAGSPAWAGDEAISLFTIKAACYTAWDCFALLAMTVYP